MTRGKIRASIWLNNSKAIPAELCVKDAPLWDYGFYRRLDSGDIEFISFCNPTAADMFGVYKDDLEEMLNETLPKKQGSKLIGSVLEWNKAVEGHIPVLSQESRSK